MICVSGIILLRTKSCSVLTSTLQLVLCPRVGLCVPEILGTILLIGLNQGHSITSIILARCCLLHMYEHSVMQILSTLSSMLMQGH
jgi:hypothetical protein